MARPNKGLPLQPGAYMSSLDRGIWLLEHTRDGGKFWRMPGGFRIIQSAASTSMWDVVQPHLPFRRMVPTKRSGNNA